MTWYDQCLLGYTSQVALYFIDIIHSSAHTIISVQIGTDLLVIHLEAHQNWPFLDLHSELKLYLEIH